MKGTRIGITLLFLSFLFPLIVLVILSFTASWRFPDLIPASFSLRPFRYVSSQLYPIARSIFGSLAYSLSTVGLCTLICLPAASLFARENFKGKQTLEVLFLLPALVPSITFSMGIHYTFLRIGIANSYAGVILVLTMFSFPYMLRALTAGFRAYGRAYSLCAGNLGAGLLTRLLKIELPLIAPSLAAGGSIVFLVAFTEYFLVFLIGGGSVPSYSGYLFPMLLSSDRPAAALLTLIFLCVPLLLFVVLDAGVIRLYRKKGLI